MRAARYSRRQMRSGPLVLVNRQHPLAEEPRQLLTAADERYPNILLERQAARLLAACCLDAGGAREIVPVSGWRSQAEQQAIWEDTLQRRGEAFARQYVAANDGNISVRTAPDRIWVTPTGVSKGYMTEDMLLCVDLEGRVLGRHQGLECYTTGQRKGLGVSAGKHVYVLSLIHI